MNSRKYLKNIGLNLNVVGKNIKYYRTKNNMSRQDLSDKLMLYGFDISSQSIFDIETGNRSVIDCELCIISKILNTTSDELLSSYRKSLDNFNKY